MSSVAGCAMTVHRPFDRFGLREGCRLSRVDLASDEQEPIIAEFIRLIEAKGIDVLEHHREGIALFFRPSSVQSSLPVSCFHSTFASGSGRFEGALVMIADEALAKHCGIEERKKQKKKESQETVEDKGAKKGRNKTNLKKRSVPLVSPSAVGLQLHQSTLA